MRRAAASLYCRSIVLHVVRAYLGTDYHLHLNRLGTYSCIYSYEYYRDFRVKPPSKQPPSYQLLVPTLQYTSS